MKKCSESICASIDSINTAGMVDGPGIRTVIFFNGCKLRCSYCHNPETWKMGKKQITVDEIFNIILRNKPYYKNGGGATFSGGEPLLHSKFIIELCKKLKEENIHTALDTAGVGNGNYEEILKYIDLVILDIKHIDNIEYKKLTGYEITESLKFIEVVKKMKKDVWIRQVIIPNYNDNIEYINKLKKFISDIPNIKKIELLPYHTSGISKYKELGIDYKLKDVLPMDINKCNELQKILNS